MQGMIDAAVPPARQPAARKAERVYARAALLVIEEPCISEWLSVNFRAAGWFPITTASAAEGRRLAEQVRPDLVLMDLDSPATADGDWMRELTRAEGRPRPIHTVALSSRPVSAGGFDGHDCAAEICVRKPLDAPDLMTRLQRLVRPQQRRGGAAQGRSPARSVLRSPNIELDLHQPTVRLRRAQGWVMLDLPRNEHHLLEHLLRHPDRVHSREAIRGALWPGELVELRTVDQYVRRLRRVLHQAGAGDLVGTVIGSGYRLKLDALDRLPD